MKRFLFVLVATMLLFSLPLPAAAADQAELTWNNPLNRTDQSIFDPTKEISAFKIYYGVTNPPTIATTVPVTASYPAIAIDQKYTVTGLSNATTYYFQVSIVDQYGQESAKSSVVSKTTLSPAPSTGCTNLRIK